MKTNYLGKEINLCEETTLYGGSFYNDLRVYEEDKLMKFGVMIRQPEKRVLLDIGASTGSYSLLPLVVPNLTVWSFEPCDSVFSALCKNLMLNGLSPERCRNMPISNYTGYGTLNEVVDNSQKALSILDGKPADHKKTKQSMMWVASIDYFCDVNDVIPTAIKIDVEGNELNVLMGGVYIIDKYRPVIQCEYSQENANQYGYNVEEIKKLLESMEYKCEIKDADLIAYQ